MRLFQFSFRVAVLLFVLTFIPAFPGQARAAADTWVPINSVDVGGSVGRNQSALVFNPSTNEPYVVSVDYANAYAITVKKFNGSSWVPVGSSGFGAASEGNASLAFNPVTNEPYVSYSDKVNGKVSVFRFNGSSWVPVGNAGFSIGNQAFAPTLTFNPNTNEPYVAYLDVGYPPGSQLKNRVVVMKFDGTSWVAVGGTGFDPGSSNPLSIAFDSSTGEPYVAYINGTSHGITMRKFDGTLWVPVSSPGVGTWADLAINPSTNEPVVAYLDDTCGSRISVKRYDGLSWLPFGDQCVATGTPTELDLEFNPLNGHPYIAFIDAFYSANDTFQPVVITFDGTSWVLVPGTGENASGPYDINLAIKPSNGQPYVLYDWAAVSPASSTDPLGIAGITIKTPPTKTAYSACFTTNFA